MIYLTVICVLELALVAYALWYVQRVEAMWATERGDLLQRIQAPHVAVMQHEAQAMGPVPLHVPFDDDEEFQASKEDLADLGWKEELSGSR